VSPIDRQRGGGGDNAEASGQGGNGATNESTINDINSILSSIPLPIRNRVSRTNGVANVGNISDSVNNIQQGEGGNNNLLGRKRENDNELIDREQINNMNETQNENRDGNLSVSSFDMVIEEYVEDEGNISGTESD
jgi:hypothetical protein